MSQVRNVSQILQHLPVLYMQAHFPSLLSTADLLIASVLICLNPFVQKFSFLPITLIQNIPESGHLY
jgi:hypothetical protein